MKQVRLSVAMCAIVAGATGLVLGAGALLAGPAPSLAVDPPAVSQLSSQATPITITINASGLSGSGLTPVGGYQYGVEWNPAVLQWLSGPEVGPGTPTPQPVLPGCTLLVTSIGTPTPAPTRIFLTNTPTPTNTNTPGPGTPTDTPTSTPSPAPISTPNGYILVGCVTFPGAPTPMPSGVLGTFAFRPLATAQAGSALNLINVKLVDAQGNLVTPGPSASGGVVNLTYAIDSDLDGCSDVREPLLGPPTSPDNPWDFYSVPVPALFAASNPLVVFKDKTVSGSDAQAVFAYMKQGAKAGAALYDQDLNLNGIADGVEYDRSYVGPGQTGPPDGVISASDAQLASAQFKNGYAC